MSRNDKPPRRRPTSEPVDKLEEALRQIGADILEEPIPESLRRVLRGEPRESGRDEEPVSGERRKTGGR